ncbi:MAG: sensor histidine kinase [Bacteroidia bacterium]|nr:sensor histidine kinase [Bacteroidia bacterium]
MLANAFKFTPSPGHVRLVVDCTPKPGQPRHLEAATIQVTDTGVGISPQHCAKIFDRFCPASRLPVPPRKAQVYGLSLTKNW